MLQRSGVLFPPRSTNTPPIFTPPVSRSTLTSTHDPSVYGVLNDPPTTHDGMSSDVGNLRYAFGVIDYKFFLSMTTDTTFVPYFFVIIPSV